MKKILVLNGSPKKGASATLNVTKAFVDGMLSNMKLNMLIYLI